MTKKLETRSYRLEFITPAFLGNADQQAQWRTPPFKALLRQWWRVAVVRDYEYDYQKIREAEGKLFGHAWLENGKDKDSMGKAVSARKSAVRLRLGKWDQGRMHSWESDPLVRHPEVKAGEKKIGSHLYLGYGPLKPSKGKGKETALKANAAIQAGENTEFRVAFPSDQQKALETTLHLIHLYGTIGGRSRNGWGSFELLSNNGTQAFTGDVVSEYQDDWQHALQQDWPHVIGADDKGVLVWSTDSSADWKPLMQKLAKIKIGLRTNFKFNSGNNTYPPESRHWLSYPVTKHSISGWSNKRLPNSLRLKVRRGDQGKLYAAIFHMPCKPPQDFHSNNRVLQSVWSEVHAFLDAQSNLKRCPS